MSALSRRALCLCLALAACGGGAPAPSSEPEPGLALEPRVVIGGLEAVEQALAAQRGQACLLNFWATWCPPCVAELPDLMAVAREYEQRGGRVIGVSYDLMRPGVVRQTVEETVRKFLAERDLPLPGVIYDAPDSESIDTRFDLPGYIPVTLAFDKSGKLVDREDGPATRERFAEMMQRALGP
jgi:thiol-disulfide isomerase/thioredoxin